MGKGLNPEQVAAFSTVFTQLSPRLYRTALGILGNPHDASDALQEAGLRAMRHWGSLQHPGAAPAWLTRIVVNCCRDVIRHRGGIVPTGLLVRDTPAPTPADSDPDLWSALGTLPTDQRETVVLRFFQDLTVLQIAQITEVPEGTVKSRLHTAMTRLRSRLSDRSKEGVR